MSLRLETCDSERDSTLTSGTSDKERSESYDDFYFGFLTTKDAEMLLLQEGDFLIRKCEVNGMFFRDFRWTLFLNLFLKFDSHCFSSACTLVVCSHTTRVRHCNFIYQLYSACPSVTCTLFPSHPLSFYLPISCNTHVIYPGGYKSTIISVLYPLIICPSKSVFRAAVFYCRGLHDQSLCDAL